MGNVRDVCGGALSPRNAVKPQPDGYFVTEVECAGGLFGEIWSGCIVPELLLEPGDTETCTFVVHLGSNPCCFDISGKSAVGSS